MHVRRRTIGLLIGFLAAMVVTGCAVDPTYYQDRGLRRYYQLNRVEAARSDFQRAVDLNPTLWESQYHLGLIALKNSQLATARQHLELAFALVRDQPTKVQDVVDALAEAMFQQGDYPQLFGLLTEVADQYGTTRDFLRRAQYFVRAGDHDNAQIAFRQAIKIAGPKDPKPYLALAGFYRQVGATDRALVVLRQAYSIAPSDQKVAQAIRDLGEVPGPTIALPPER